MLTIAIQKGNDEIDSEEWRYLLTGPTGEIEVPENPCDWLDQNTWSDIYKQVYCSNKLPCFEGFLEKFIATPDDWKTLYDSKEPEKLLNELPGEYKDKSDFQKIILLKCFRPGKVIPAIENYITKYQGQKFIIPPTFNLEECYNDSSAVTPLIFVLSSGSDPVADFKRFAEEMKMGDRYDSTSLGQG